MARPLSLKLALAAAILLVVANAAASSHAHAGALADEPCSVCVASADIAPAALAPEAAPGPTHTQRKFQPPAATPFPARHAAYAARAPPAS